MPDDITIYYQTRLLRLPLPEMDTIMESIGKDGQAPTPRDIQVALAAFRMGAALAAKQIGNQRGARLERDLMGETDLRPNERAGEGREE